MSAAKQSEGGASDGEGDATDGAKHYKVILSQRGKDHHIMRFHTPRPFRLDELVNPVKMFREPRPERERRPEEAPAPLIGPGSTYGAQPKQRRFFRRRPINEDRRSWILEDRDKAHQFVGKREAQAASYALFVLRDDSSFELTPVEKFYKFTPKITYKTLTIEQVEEQLNTKTKRAEYAHRWMNKRLGIGADEADAKEPGEKQGKKAKADDDDDEDIEMVAVDERDELKRFGKKEAGDADEEAGLDFEEKFDDDEEDAPRPVDESEESQPKAFKDDEDNLTEEGKKIKSLLKEHQGLGSGSEEEEDEDISDPDKDREELKQQPPPRPAESKSRKRRAEDADSPQKKKVKTEAASAPRPLTEDAVRQLLARKPLGAKKLKRKFKEALSENPEANMNILRGILSRVARREKDEDGNLFFKLL
eukprot:Opistho-2@80515